MPSPRTILITGATGFVGGATLAELLLHMSDCKILALVRDTGTANFRLRNSLERFLDPAICDRNWARIEIVPGDICQEATYLDPRFDQVTHVIHLAANTSLRSTNRVREVNLKGTILLRERLRQLKRLERVLHVGTAFICGLVAPPVVKEEVHPRGGVLHVAKYTATKAEAELWLEDDFAGLPLIVARPSIVVGHTQFGCRPSASLYWYYRALSLLRQLPVPPDTPKDIVPVDYVAKALVHLLFKPNLRHRRYHVSAGESSCSSWQAICDGFNRHELRANLEPLQKVGSEALADRSRWQHWLGPGDEVRLASVLEVLFRFSRCGVHYFDNNRLLAEGMPAPPRFTDYLPVCIRSTRGRSVYQMLFDDL